MPINDLALLRGYGVFDYFLMYGGRPLFFEEHWQRLNRSAKALNLAVPFGREALLDMISVLYRQTPYPHAGLHILLTGGNSIDGYSPAEKPNSVVSLRQLAPLPKQIISQGIALKSHAYRRAVPTAKSIDYTMAIMLLPQIKQEGFDDLLYALDGWVSECPRSNLFIVTRANVLVTPNAGVLEGITRGRILRHARSFMQVEERPLYLEELHTASEVFISSTTKGIWSVRQVDENVIGDGFAGPVASRLYEMLLAEMQMA